MLEIEQAFTADFIAQGFGLPIAHENSGFEPVAGTPYVELTMFPNDETGASLAHRNETDGFFQFVLRYPENGGAITAKTMRETMLAAYPVARILTYGGQKVHITGQHGMRGINEGGWFRLTCAVFYRAFTPR